MADSKRAPPLCARTDARAQTTQTIELARIRTRLLSLDGQGVICIGQASIWLGHERVPRHRAHRCENARVAHPALLDLLLHHA